MDNPAVHVIEFLARYSVFGVLPGFWFAYIGGISLWIGGLAGFLLTLALHLSIRISRAMSRYLAARRYRSIWDI